MALKTVRTGHLDEAQLAELVALVEKVSDFSRRHGCGFMATVSYNVEVQSLDVGPAMVLSCGARQFKASGNLLFLRQDTAPLAIMARSDEPVLSRDQAADAWEAAREVLSEMLNDCLKQAPEGESVWLAADAHDNGEHTHHFRKSSENSH